MNAEEIQGIDPAEDAITEQPEVEETEVTEPESSTEQDQAEADEPKQPKGVQKRLNELTANWREEQRRAQKLEAMLERVLTQQQQPKAEEVVQPVGEPKLDQFQTYEEYVAALADYRADQKIQAWENQRKQQEAERQKSQVVEQFQTRAERFRVEHPDFDEIAFNPQLPVTDAMAEAINLAENGPELLYQLGKNPSEAARIAALPPIQAAVELGKFAVKMSLPQPRSKTGAPPPIRPLDGGAGTAVPDPDKMTTSEWLAWREQSIRK